MHIIEIKKKDNLQFNSNKDRCQERLPNPLHAVSLEDVILLMSIKLRSLRIEGRLEVSSNAFVNSTVSDGDCMET